VSSSGSGSAAIAPNMGELGGYMRDPRWLMMLEWLESARAAKVSNFFNLAFCSANPLFGTQDACAAMAQYAQKGRQEIEGVEEVRELVRLIGMGEQAWESLGLWVEAAEKEAERQTQEAEAAKEWEHAEVETVATRAAEEEVRQAQEKAWAAAEEVERAQRGQVAATGKASEVADVDVEMGEAAGGSGGRNLPGQGKPL
jgi:hypothetical protein